LKIFFPLFVRNQTNVLESLKLNFYYCNIKDNQLFTFMKAEHIHGILGQVYFAIEGMVIQLNSVKRMLVIPSCMCKLCVVLGVMFLKNGNFRGKRRNV